MAMMAMTIIAAWAQTGEVPRVTTNKRFARGTTMAFARATFNGSNISERGLCYSTSLEPTIDDNRSTLYYSYDDNGTIYYIEGLTPATKYYMRPYAKTKTGEVGYGDAIKFYTLPKASVTYSVRSGGDSAAVVRITAATKEAVELWNNLTSIRGVNFNVGHNDGTPTADCSYGGYIRVGSNSSYQRTGTLLHEMLHGVGVGTHSVWWNSEIRSNGDRGYWLGDRVTEVVRFLENNDTEQLNGDNTHMWPYGINGAHEDSGAKGLYIGCSLICQALGEDGLPPSGGFASPAYTFDQEDTIKYYLKNEDEDHGLATSYLVQNADGSLAWKPQTDVTANDSAAWYITFVPSVSYYVFQNAATGRYLSFQSEKFTTRETTNPLYTERMQLMCGRVDVFEGKDYRGYYIIKNSATTTPATMTAADDNAVSNTAYNLSTSATTQRWLILTAEQTKDIEDAGISGYQTKLNNLIAFAKTLLETPYEENTAGSGEALTTTLGSVETAAATASDIATIDQLTTQLQSACVTFLEGVSPSDVNNPFDISFYIENPGFDDSEGWTGDATLNYSCAEFYATTFNFSQTLTDMPKGIYQLRAQAFQRLGSVADSYSKHTNGGEAITTYLFGNSSSKKVACIWDEAQATKVGKGNESEQGGLYVPNDMESAEAYFDKGLYDNFVRIRLTKQGDLKIGLNSLSQPASYWTAFDNFRLYFFGTKNPPTNAIADVNAEKANSDKAIYDLQGRRLNAKSKDELKRGIYIIGGKKVVVR